jgi:Tfp pilus assembly protein PilN
MIRINLLPQRRRRRLIPESGVVFTALVVIGALVASYAWEAWRNHEVAAETVALNAKLVVVRRQAAEVLALEAKIEELRAREQLLQSLEARELPWAEMLTDLAGRTPHDAWLGSAAVNPGAGGLALSLQGSALSYDAVARFMTTLEGSAFYNDVGLEAAQRSMLAGSPVIQFGLTLTLRPMPVAPGRAAAAPAVAPVSAPVAQGASR